MGKIPAERILHQVRQYCELYNNQFFDSASLYEQIPWSNAGLKRNIKKQGLAQTLSLATAYDDQHGFLRPVSQIRIISSCEEHSKYGIFYGCKDGFIPGKYRMTWQNPGKKGTLDLMLNVIRRDKPDIYNVSVKKIDFVPYKELKDNLLKS